jgi:N-acetylglucosamine-6-phosphate deacetylase
MIAFSADVLFTPDERIEHPRVLVDDGVIVQMAPAHACELPSGCEEARFPGAVLAPGFVDLHVHGGAGHDVMEADPAALPAIEALSARHGVTAYVPTTVTASMEATLAALDHLAGAIERSSHAGDETLRARPLGIHLEGPFISHAKRGVHPPANIIAPDLKTFDRLWQAARGHIRVMTIAPELEGALEVIREAARLGVCVSLGHSDATFEVARQAMAAGARHATHTFNAMRPLDHRDPGIVGAVLTSDRVTADIIADGIHLAPAIVELFLRNKGENGAVLITDAISATGMPDGTYRLGAMEVEVRAGKCTYQGKLAGSVLTLDRAVRNVMDFAPCTLQQAVRLATANPARALNVAAGRLQPGAPADLAVLSPAGEVIRTVIRGR